VRANNMLTSKKELQDSAFRHYSLAIPGSTVSKRTR